MRTVFVKRIVGLLLALGLATSAQAQVKVTVGGTAFPNTAGEEQWLGFERNVKRLGGDQFELKMLIYGQLGSEEQLVSGLRRNRVHFANLSAMVASTVVPETAMLYAPYLFDSYEEADFVYDNYLTDKYRELLAEGDLHLVAWNEIGFHHLYGKDPVLSPADAQGLRFRVSAAPSARLFAKSLDADIIPLGFADIVSSLQTGLIAAGENAVTLYARTGTAGEAPHLTLTAHALGMSVIVTRKRWWDRLQPDQRRILTEAFPTIAQSRKAIRNEENGDIAQSESLGFTVHELTPAQKAAWVAATRGTHAQLIKEVGGESQAVYDLIMEGKRAFAAQQGQAAQR